MLLAYPASNGDAGDANDARSYHRPSTFSYEDSGLRL